jgi:hypothetical protein
MEGGFWGEGIIWFLHFLVRLLQGHTTLLGHNMNSDQSLAHTTCSSRLSYCTLHNAHIHDELIQPNSSCFCLLHRRAAGDIYIYRERAAER